MRSAEKSNIRTCSTCSAGSRPAAARPRAPRSAALRSAVPVPVPYGVRGVDQVDATLQRGEHHLARLRQRAGRADTSGPPAAVARTAKSSSGGWQVHLGLGLVGLLARGLESRGRLGRLRRAALSRRVAPGAALRLGTFAVLGVGARPADRPPARAAAEQLPSAGSVGRACDPRPLYLRRRVALARPGSAQAGAGGPRRAGPQATIQRVRPCELVVRFRSLSSGSQA